MPATPAWPPRSAPRLFVKPPLSAGAQVVLEGPQAHYLARVMRAAEGDPVVLCDDLTGEWAARVVRSDKRSLELLATMCLRTTRAAHSPVASSHSTTASPGLARMTLAR